MSSDDRRLDVLRAIIEDYVATREPVGSRALSERHQLGVSPATIRNDMAALEEAGLIVQPHTSAGRVPTDMGYRQFVDRLADIKPLSLAERRAISTLLEQAVDLDDVIDRAADRHRPTGALTQRPRCVDGRLRARSAVDSAAAAVETGQAHDLRRIAPYDGRSQRHQSGADPVAQW